MLSRIKHYLHNRGPVCLSDIALHLGSTPDAARGMLETWMRKGRVTRRTIESGCGTSCGKCRPDDTELYEWVDGGAV
ncbi:FeoC-like transcriptional regulator [Sedimenticola hydrogenitrophicus]|uniref:FeoC-like transcriptional regulator n=1 Tax=Sedimenticola hydrogenitrophicus TaxID=2967975 RepID=UPI0023B0344E|nr:FeoC-like transcriptional regulator [Sedimenticola hydrogenitrophicus]